MLSGPFSHLQQPHLQHHTSQHQQQPSSAGLPPPSFNSGHPSFAQGNPNPNFSAFSPTNSTNGLATAFGGTSTIAAGGTGLASHAAVMGFAHGAAMQQQQAREAARRTSGVGKGPMKGRIRDVWRTNLAQEMQVLRGLVEKYPYISMVSYYQPVRLSCH